MNWKTIMLVLSDTMILLARGTRGIDADCRIGKGAQTVKAFQRADFIERAIGNVERALIEGGIMVTVVLFLFLWNFRTTVISYNHLYSAMCCHGNGELLPDPHIAYTRKPAMPARKAR